MTAVESIFVTIENVTWGWAMVPLLVISGIFITALTGFVQIRFFGRMLRDLRARKTPDGDKAISPRQALMISVGGRVGGGNIVGVATAIMLGGPGAIFWMWAMALAGMATSLVECTLAQLYKRRQPNGDFRGGPAQVILYGLGERFRWLAIVYAVSLIAAFGLGFNAFQGNTVAGAINEGLGISRTMTGVALAVLTGYIIFGGIHRIAGAMDVIVPVMALGYIFAALAIIAINITAVPTMLIDIVANAFGFREAVSGGAGAAIAQGLRRGLASNEAGLGSAPNVAATATVSHPISQGVTQSFSVFIDTIMICTCTAFIILLSGAYSPGAAPIDGIILAQQSLVWHFGEGVRYFLSLILVLFGFSSIIYNYYLGENAVTFITRNRMGIFVLRLFVIAIVFAGAIAPNATAVFFFADPMMGILGVVNLVVILMLLPVCLRMLDDFKSQIRAGNKEPRLDPDKFADLDIDRSAWPQEVLT